MRLTLRQLQIFVAIADAGSTAAAAVQVALSQSAASGALTELESVLSIQLFDRVGKRLVLNDDGRALLPEARIVLDTVREIEARCAGPGTGGPVLRLAASTTIGNYLLPALVARFVERHPEATIDVFIGNTREVVGKVARVEVDLGLIEGPCHERELVAEPWRRDDLVIVAAPTHAVFAGRPKGPCDFEKLRAARWLLREEGSGTREAVEQVLLPHLHQLDTSMQMGSNEAIRQAAAEGLGLTCLSRAAVDDLITAGRLAIVPTALPPLSRQLYRVRHGRKRLSRALEGFVALESSVGA